MPGLRASARPPALRFAAPLRRNALPNSISPTSADVSGCLFQLPLRCLFICLVKTRAQVYRSHHWRQYKFLVIRGCASCSSLAICSKTCFRQRRAMPLSRYTVNACHALGSWAASDRTIWALAKGPTLPTAGPNQPAGAVLGPQKPTWSRFAWLKLPFLLASQQAKSHLNRKRF